MQKKELLELVQKAAKDSKYNIGFKEVKKAIKSMKLIIYTRSLSESEIEILKKDTPNGSYLMEYDGSSIELGRSIKKEFPVSVLAFRTLDSESERLAKGS